MIKIKSKRGLSPVVATVLLILLAVILAIIIFLMAKNISKMGIEKNGEPIENSCELVNFEADAYVEGGKIYLDIGNNGNVPLYSVQVKKGSSTLEESVGGLSEPLLLQGGMTAIKKGGISAGNIETGEIITVIPILAGKKDDEIHTYVCKKQGIEIAL